MNLFLYVGLGLILQIVLRCVLFESPSCALAKQVSRLLTHSQLLHRCLAGSALHCLRGLLFECFVFEQFVHCFVCRLSRLLVVLILNTGWLLSAFFGSFFWNLLGGLLRFGFSFGFGIAEAEQIGEEIALAGWFRLFDRFFLLFGLFGLLLVLGWSWVLGVVVMIIRLLGRVLGKVGFLLVFDGTFLFLQFLLALLLDFLQLLVPFCSLLLDVVDPDSREADMSVQKLFSLEENVELLLLFLAFLQLPVVNFEPRLDLLAISETGLEEFELNVLDCLVEDEVFNVAGNEVAQVLDCHLVVDVHSFLQF